MLVQSLAANPAAAQTPPSRPPVSLKGPVSGKIHGMVPAAPAAKGLAQTPVDLAGTSFAATGNLSYYGGPVMHSSSTYAIYWEPTGSTVSANYASLINGFLGNVAVASGTSANVYAPNVQYYDTTGQIAYSSTFAGSYVDTTTPIPDDCSGEYAGRKTKLRFSPLGSSALAIRT